MPALDSAGPTVRIRLPPAERVRKLSVPPRDGQVLGGFAHAVGAALYEEFAYGQDGSFLSGTFADYPVPTAYEIPTPVILHCETPSPVTPLGAKGVGEGNSMSTPVCLANAVADALDVADVALPLTPSRVAALLPARSFITASASLSLSKEAGRPDV